MRSLLDKRRRHKLNVFGKEFTVDTADPDEATQGLLEEIETRRRHPQVMLIHSHEDEAFAQRLAADMREKGIQVWLDANELKAGHSLREIIGTGIMKSQRAVFIVPSNAPRGSWLDIELKLSLESE